MYNGLPRPSKKKVGLGRPAYRHGKRPRSISLHDSTSKRLLAM